MSTTNDSFQGQVVHKRQLSRKLCFLDIVLDNEEEIDKTRGVAEKGSLALLLLRKTVILKSWICGQDVMDRALKGSGKIHCGDWVHCQGQMCQSGEELTAANFEVLL